MNVSETIGLRFFFFNSFYHPIHCFTLIDFSMLTLELYSSIKSSMAIIHKFTGVCEIINNSSRLLLISHKKGRWARKKRDLFSTSFYRQFSSRFVITSRWALLAQLCHLIVTPMRTHRLNNGLFSITDQKTVAESVQTTYEFLDSRWVNYDIALEFRVYKKQALKFLEFLRALADNERVLCARHERPLLRLKLKLKL